MSQKLQKIEEEIVLLQNKKSKLELSKARSEFMGNFNSIDPFLEDDTPESIDSKIKSKEKERQFQLEKEERCYKRKWYNQSWLHVLVTATVTLIATLLAS